jgi:hypothetical protein
LKRRLFNVLAGVSLLLCVPMAGMWVRSYQLVYIVDARTETWPQSSVWRSRAVDLRLVQGYWIFHWGGDEFKLDHPEGISVGWGRSDAINYKRQHPGGLHWDYYSWGVIRVFNADNLLGIPHQYGFGYKYEFRNNASRMDINHYVIVPAWLSIVLLLLLPVAWAYQWHRRRSFYSAGCCRACGYDLRATPDRCPECGTIPTNIAQSKA